MNKWVCIEAQKDGAEEYVKTLPSLGDRYIGVGPRAFAEGEGMGIDHHKRFVPRRQVLLHVNEIDRMVERGDLIRHRAADGKDFAVTSTVSDAFVAFGLDPELGVPEAEAKQIREALKKRKEDAEAAAKKAEEEAKAKAAEEEKAAAEAVKKAKADAKAAMKGKE